MMDAQRQPRHQRSWSHESQRSHQPNETGSTAALFEREHRQADRCDARLERVQQRTRCRIVPVAREQAHQQRPFAVVAPAVQPIIGVGRQRRLHQTRHKHQQLNGVQSDGGQRLVCQRYQSGMHVAANAFLPFPRQVAVAGIGIVMVRMSRTQSRIWLIFVLRLFSPECQSMRYFGTLPVFVRYVPGANHKHGQHSPDKAQQKYLQIARATDCGCTFGNSLFKWIESHYLAGGTADHFRCVLV